MQGARKPLHLKAPKLKKGDKVAIVSPSLPFEILSKELRETAESNFRKLGLKIEYFNGKSGNELESKISNFNQATERTDIKAIFSSIGGWGANMLLPYINYKALANTPKILCGYSDFSAILNAVYTKTDLMTYHGPHYSTLGQKKFLDYTLDYLSRSLFTDGEIVISPSPYWLDDEWYLDQENRHPFKNTGPFIINEGEAEGLLVGGNQFVFSNLKGTEYMPKLDGKILFLEDDDLASQDSFLSQLVSLSQQTNFRKVQGIVIGRFQKKSNIDLNQFRNRLKLISELNNIPIIANLDFGHTNPMIALPIGGIVYLKAKGQKVNLIIKKH